MFEICRLNVSDCVQQAYMDYFGMPIEINSPEYQICRGQAVSNLYFYG